MKSIFQLRVDLPQRNLPLTANLRFLWLLKALQHHVSASRHPRTYTNERAQHADGGARSKGGGGTVQDSKGRRDGARYLEQRAPINNEQSLREIRKCCVSPSLISLVSRARGPRPRERTGSRRGERDTCRCITRFCTVKRCAHRKLYSGKMYSGARLPIKRRKFLGSFAGRRRRGREGGRGCRHAVG